MDAVVLYPQIGTKNEAAAADGSLHAKVATILAKNIVANDSVIKSIQRGTIALSTSQTSNTATISTVTTDKTMVNSLGVSASGAQASENPNYAYTGHFHGYLTLTNATTVTFTRDAHHSTAATVSYEVIEFY